MPGFNIHYGVMAVEKVMNYSAYTIINIYYECKSFLVLLQAAFMLFKALYESWWYGAEQRQNRG
jgi:hypothetical protein